MSSTKIILASHVRNIKYYENLKSKILKCCANIYFNKQCLNKILPPDTLKYSNYVTSSYSYPTQDY